VNISIFGRHFTLHISFNRAGLGGAFRITLTWLYPSKVVYRSDLDPHPLRYLWFVAVGDFPCRKSRSIVSSFCRWLGHLGKFQYFQILVSLECQLEISHNVDNFWAWRKPLRLDVLGRESNEGSPKIESSHIKTFFSLSGIQVRRGLKNPEAFWQNVKIGEPFETLGTVSRHLFLDPEKYFFHNTCFLQVIFPVTRF